MDTPTTGSRRGRGGWGAVARLATGCAALASIAAGPGIGIAHAQRADGGRIVDISLWESHNGPPVGTAMSTMVAAFNATHRGVHISIDVTKASTKLLAAFAAGDPPALAEISHYDGQYVKAHTLVSWNGFMKGSSAVSAASLYPVVWANGEVSGQHYRLMADVKISEVFYNQTMFRKAGITAPPTTWTQLAADAATIKAKLPGVIPLGWKDSSAHILPAFLSNGGTLLRGGNSVGRAVNFDTAAGRTTFSYFRALYARGDMVFGHGTTLREDLGSGHMAMIDGTSAGYGKALTAVAGRFPVGAFVEPAGSTGHAYNLAQGLGFVLPTGHTRAQDAAAWSFVSWWFQPQQQARWADLGTGYPPETRAGADLLPARVRNTPGMRDNLQAISSPYTLPRPVSDSYAEVQASLDAEFFDAVTGRVSVTSALATLEKQGNAYMSGASGL